MIEYLSEKKTWIAEYLRYYLKGEECAVFSRHPFGPDAVDRLLEFSLRGKMIRGALVYLGAEIYGYSGDQAPLSRLGAVMELLQSFLLIHDDIMDRDRLRRGAPSLFAQYERIGSENGVEDPLHYGESMGICAGDVAIFLATAILADDSIAIEHERRLLRLISQEIARVGLAQMSDVHHGVTSSAISEVEITDLYRFKTGRYTFSLPLMTGAVIAGADASEQHALGLIGEGLGVVFQIQDDYIGLFEDTDTIGKTVGSDISADKKTHYRIFLFEQASSAQRERLDAIFGKQSVNGDDVRYVIDTIRDLKVDERVRRLRDTYAEKTRILIRESVPSMSPEGRDRLEELLHYNLTRSA